MSVPYISPGSNISAAKMTALFAELERKLDLLLDGKSFIVVDGGIGSSSLIQMGREFYFVSGSELIFLAGKTSYDHSVYEAQVAAATEVSRDDTTGIMLVDGLPDDIFNGYKPELEKSLEAHKKEGYYMLANGWDIPEKHYKYAVAELIFEGPDFATVSFPEKYDKYNFFRIHNLNAFDMEFTFEGKGLTITVPAWGCKTVRRTSVTGTYDTSWKYFWTFKKDDPRFFVNLTFDRIYGTMLANNVTNPAILYSTIIRLTNTSLTTYGLRFFIDPHVQADCTSLYCPKYYSDPKNNTAALIGNFFHHKGILSVNSVDKTFNGYETITTDIDTVTWSDSGTELSITAISGPTAQLTTNLLSSWSTSVPTVTSLPQSLDHANTGRTNLTLVKKDATDFTYGGVTISIDCLNHVANKVTPDDLIFHAETLDDVLTLNHFGSDDYAAANQETNAVEIVSREALFTPFGLRIHFTEVIDLDGSYFNGSISGLNLFSDAINEVVDGKLIKKGYLSFDGWGWGSYTYDVLVGTDDITGVNPGFLSVRVPRAIAEPGSEAGLVNHPHIINGLIGNGFGEDFDTSPVGDNYSPTQYAWMAAIGLDNGSRGAKASFNWWKSPDGITTWPTLVPLLVEHYNAMAGWVNSITKIEPANFIYLYRQWSDTVGGVYSFPGPVPPANYNGPLGGTICPKNQYCSFAAGSLEYEFFENLGVPIKTEADLPADFLAILSGSSTPKLLQAFVHQDYTPTATFGVYDITREYTGWTVTDGTPGSMPGILGLSTTTSDPTFYWVTIEDVKNRAEMLGWKFSFQQVSHRYKFEIVTPSISQIQSLPSGTATFSGGSGPSDFAVYSTTLYSDYGILLQDDEGDWKGATAAAPTICDASPGDVYPIGFYDPLFSHAAAWKLTMPRPEYYLAMGESNPSTNPHRIALFQNYYPSALNSESLAILIPTNWVKHSQGDFSEASQANYQARLTSGLSALPIEEAGKHGVVSVYQIPYGDTTVTASTDGFFEVVPFWRTLILP